MAIVLIFIYCHCENGSMYYYKALKYCPLIYFGDRKIDLSTCALINLEQEKR